MIVANYNNVKYVYISELPDGGVTLQFIDGTDLPLFGADADKVKQDLRKLINSSTKWCKVSYGEGE
jgi:hypothetical protein